MRLTVLSVAYPLASVGPDAVGGAEQILSQLDRALVQAGHRSLVMACEGSIVAGELLATSRVDGMLTPAVLRRSQEQYREEMAHAMQRYAVDLVHLHGIDFDAYLPPTGPPALVTLHLPPSWYGPEAFRLARPRTYLHCVSVSQQRACPADAELLPVIENGVAVNHGAAPCAKRSFALAIGRICPEKNFHVALDAGARAGVSVLLAGQVFPYETHMQYFEEQILPRLDGRRRFVGPIGGDCKRQLLSAARCLLVPSLAPETSSLVAMEALACGTPVIAYPSGALPEIVEHGVTGFLVENEAAMAAAIRAVEKIDPEVCRAAARARFSLDRMIERYLAVYRMLAGSGRKAGGGATAAVMPCAEVVPSFQVEEVTTAEGLERLGAEWMQLGAAVPNATPFQTPQWLIPWWRHIGEGELWTLAVRAADGPARPGRLVGVVPLYIYQKPGSRLREVFPLGISTSDYLDALILPQYQQQALAAVMRQLNAQRHRWDLCDFQQLRADSSLRHMTVPAGWREVCGESEPCLTRPLPATAEQLADCVPSHLLQNLRYYRRRAVREGTLRTEVADRGNLAELLEAWLRLHRSRWSARGLPGVLNSAPVERFHREAAGGLLAAGVLRMYALRLDTRIIAVLYGLFDAGKVRRRFYYYLGGFDPAFERLSPGTLLIGHAMEEAIGEGAREFDFLRGSEDYKYRWGARNQTTYRRRMWHAPESPSSVQSGFP